MNFSWSLIDKNPSYHNLAISGHPRANLDSFSVECSGLVSSATTEVGQYTTSHTRDDTASMSEATNANAVELLVLSAAPMVSQHLNSSEDASYSGLHEECEVNTSIMSQPLVCCCLGDLRAELLSSEITIF